MIVWLLKALNLLFLLFLLEIPDVEGMVADNMEPEPVLVAANPEEETQAEGSNQSTNPSLDQDEEQAGLK